MDDYRKQIQDIYGWALGKGLVKNKKQFADAIEVNYCSLVSLFNGSARNSGKTTSKQAKVWKAKISQTLAKDDTSLEIRYNTAKDILCALIRKGEVGTSYESMVEKSVELTNMLITELNKTE